MLTMLAQYTRLSSIEESAVREGASLLEIQKLMYFLQEAGQRLRLKYVKAQYGPYAENLNPVLQALEGHYLRGYGDRSQQVMQLTPITLMPGAVDDGRKWLTDHPDDGTAARIDAVLRLVTGFADAYGLELLATVHWVLTHEDGELAADSSNLAKNVAAWNARKGRLFTDVHVARAADRLREHDWVAEPVN